MEEMVSSEALEREILEDARKKGERLLRDAETEQARIRAESEARTRASLGSVTADFTARAERHRNENLARLPLEKGRMKVSYIDRLLQASLSRYLEELPASRASLLVSGLLSRAAGLLAGRDLELRCRGLAPEEATALATSALPGARVVSAKQDPALPAFGLVAGAPDASITVRATIDLVGERLLDENRGELAAALCAEALAL